MQTHMKFTKFHLILVVKNGSLVKYINFRMDFFRKETCKMKRTLTVLLTACLIFQSWAGAATPVHGASYLAQQDAAGKAGADDESQDVQTDALGTGISENDEPGAVGTDASENDGLDNFDTDSSEDNGPDASGIGGSETDGAETGGTDAGNADAQESGVFAAEEGTDTEAESALEVEVRKSEKFPFQGSVKVQVRGEIGRAHV